MGSYLLGVDVGTSETKGVVVNKSGKIIARAARNHATSQPKPGYFEHDADAIWWSDFCAVVRELLSQSEVCASEIAAVGCSALGADMLPVDELGTPIRPAILYGIDTRAVRQQEELTRLVQASGRRNVHIGSGSVGAKVLWLRQNEPEAFSRMRMVATASTYLVYRLTGAWTLDRYTASAFTPMIDTESLTWNAEYCDGIVKPSYLPPIQWTTEIAGVVTSQAALQTGLKQGTPVIVGTCDAAAEAVSVGVTDIGDMMIMYGTTGFFVGCSQEPISGPGISAMPYVTPGVHVYAAGTSAAGGSTRWFLDNFAVDLVLKHRNTPHSAYSDLARLAAEVPAGSGGLVFLPYLSGERSPITDPSACGILFGLNLCHDRRHVYRSILEGVAYSMRHCIETIKAAGGCPAHVVAVGGGTKNPLWMQIVSDVTGVVQHIPEETIGAAYGDAFLAGIGIGMFSSLDEIKSKWIQISQVVKPNDANKTLYDKLYSLYTELYSATKTYMHQITTIRSECL